MCGPSGPGAGNPGGRCARGAQDERAGLLRQQLDLIGGLEPVSDVRRGLPDAGAAGVELAEGVVDAVGDGGDRVQRRLCGRGRGEVVSALGNLQQ